MAGYYGSMDISMVVLHRRTGRSRHWGKGKRTEVVLTPQFSDGGCGEGAAGVSMNSKSSDDSECVFDMTAVSTQRSQTTSWYQTQGQARLWPKYLLESQACARQYLQ